MRLPKEIELRFVEKRESPIADFIAVKLVASTADRDIPIVVYVDTTAERVIMGSLIIRGENVTQREAGAPKSKKPDLAQIDTDKSPFRGSADAKVTIVEFSNFQCPYCQSSWATMRGLLEKRPRDVKYVFKHFPLQTEGKAYEVSEMAAAAQEVSSEAFWAIHDFLFSQEGQEILKGEKEAISQKIRDKLKETGYDENVFLGALERGKGKERVNEDLAVGKKLRVKRTPTTIMNGDLVRTPITEQTIDQYLKQ